MDLQILSEVNAPCHKREDSTTPVAAEGSKGTGAQKERDELVQNVVSAINNLTYYMTEGSTTHAEVGEEELSRRQVKIAKSTYCTLLTFNDFKNNCSYII